MQEVSLNKNIKILDCPGIVMATGSSEAAVILRNCVKVSKRMDCSVRLVVFPRCFLLAGSGAAITSVVSN